MTDLNMLPFADIALPPELALDRAERDPSGETNDVYRCAGTWQGRPVQCHVKVAKQAQHALGNEKAVLLALASSDIPVPRVLAYSGGERPALVLETVTGRMAWDFIDPRRDGYDRERVTSLLRAYGRCLGQIHGLALDWPPQQRLRLEGLTGEEQIADAGFQHLVAWLRAHAPSHRDEVFVHGDLNTASVLVKDGVVSGVIDWEFAGRGWREYDLAWMLRARTAFLNTPAERDALLAGYDEMASYDADALRWCEVLNYLHFARWSLAAETDYAAFALERAKLIAGLT